MPRRAVFIACAAFLLVFAGCGKQTYGNLTKAELEAFVGQKCKLKDVKLEAKGNGTFAGTGVSEDGRAFTLEATQQAKGLSWTATYVEQKDGKNHEEVRSGTIDENSETSSTHTGPVGK